MLPLHYTAYLYIYIYVYNTMNIYNKLGASHKKSITHEGKKPKKIVGTIKVIIKTVSLYVQSEVKLI